VDKWYSCLKNFYVHCSWIHDHLGVQLRWTSLKTRSPAITDKLRDAEVYQYIRSKIRVFIC